MTEHVAVIGAGPAGVSVALSLRDRGLRPLLIDRADHVGSSWRGRYDRLKLNTGRPFSHLPNRPYPKGTPMFPSRDDVVAHLDRHAQEDGIELRLATEVDPHRPAGGAGGAWRPRPARSTRARSSSPLETSTPRAFRSGPGADGFTGELLHSSEYRNPQPVSGQEGIGRRLRLVGHGDRARPRDRRRGQGLAGRPNTTEHPVAVTSRRSARRSGLAAAVPRARLRRRRDRPERLGAQTSATSPSSGCRFRKRACSRA